MTPIDKDIPIPPLRKKQPRYPFTDMEIGHSFAVPVEKAKSVRAMVFKHQGETARRYATRRVTENGAEVIRVWRTE